MRYSRHKALHLRAAALTLLLALARAHAESLVYTTLEPKEITLGESARLTITNLGTDSRDPKLPVVAGLQFEVIGHTRQFDMANGVMLPSTSIIVQVSPQIAGTFTIPAIAPNAQALILNVKVDHGPTGSSGPGNSNYMIRPPVLAIPNKHAALPVTDSAAFVRLNLPKRDVYVGESVPVDIEVGVRSGIVTAMNGLPTLHGGEFTLDNLSHQPDREEKVFDDKHFTMLTWHSVLAAVKPGVFSLDVETPLTVKISTRPKQDSALDELLGDPFLQNYFGSTVSKHITVLSPTTDLKVLPIPQAGRPADFTGAVGSFNVTTEITPATAAAGDPVTLRMRVSGSGNFDRVSSEMFKRLDDWKTYPAKSSFHASDTVGYRGEKTFEQPLVAPKPGAHTVPALAFSYFDPLTRRFATALSAPISVNVTSALADAAPNGPGVAPAGDALLRALHPDHAATGSTESSLVPPYLRAGFLAVPSLTTVLIAGAWLGLRRRMALPPRGRFSKAGQRQWLRLKAAADAKDAALFSTTARTLLKETLAERWHMRPQDITTETLHTRLGAKGAELSRLFQLADETQYGTDKSAVVDFSHWMQRVQEQLRGDA